MAHLLIFDGHPDPSSFTAALAAAYEAGARPHTSVERLALRELTFDPILHRGYAAPQPLEPDLQRATAAIAAARHVTWLYPSWWNAPPALVKGFLDRVLLPGFAFRYDQEHALPVKLLAGRSGRLVTSMDSPRWWHLLVNRSALHHQFLRSTLGFVGFSPVSCETIYDARKLGPGGRQKLLERLGRLGALDARSLARRSAAAA